MRSEIYKEIEATRERYFNEIFKNNPSLLNGKLNDRPLLNPGIRFRITTAAISEIQEVPVQENLSEEIQPDTKFIEETEHVQYSAQNETVENIKALTDWRQKLLNLFFSWFLSEEDYKTISEKAI